MWFKLASRLKLDFGGGGGVWRSKSLIYSPYRLKFKGPRFRFDAPNLKNIQQRKAASLPGKACSSVRRGGHCWPVIQIIVRFFSEIRLERGSSLD